MRAQMAPAAVSNRTYRGTEISRPFLSLRNLLRRQLTFQRGQVLLGILIALPGRQQEPPVSLDPILRHAVAIVKQTPKLY